MGFYFLGLDLLPTKGSDKKTDEKSGTDDLKRMIFNASAG